MTTKYSITHAPDYSIHREGIATADTMSGVIRAHGCNADQYKYAHVQVIPADGANPSVAVHYWSEQAEAFIQQGGTIAGAGADTPYEFTIEPMGRIFFIQIVAIATGSVDVMVSGFERPQFV